MTEKNAAETLHADTKHSVNDSARTAKRHRFDDVVTFEHAKQALMQLGYKARAARAALNVAFAHVGGNADVALLVKTALKQRDLQRPASEDDLQADATKALTQLGYSHALARAAVTAASAHVGATAELTTLIKEALRRCGRS